MTITGARNLITVADPPLQRGGFLDGATVIDVPDGDHSLLGIEFDSYACMGQANPFQGDWCSTDDGSADCVNGEWVNGENGGKAFDPADFLVTGDPIALYRGVQCATGLQPTEHTRMQARRSFDFAERRTLDYMLLEWIKANPLLVVTTPGPSDPAVALGLLEVNLLGGYGGTPLIAVPIQLLAVFCREGLLESNGDGTFHTCAGSTVVGISAGANENVIYGMGRMILVRGPLNEYDAPPQTIACWAPGIPASGGATFRGSLIYEGQGSVPTMASMMTNTAGIATSGLQHWAKSAFGSHAADFVPGYKFRLATFLPPPVGNVGDPEQWSDFQIAGTITDNGGHVSFPVTHIGAGPDGEANVIVNNQVYWSALTGEVAATPDYVTGWINQPARALVERIYVPAIECQPMSAQVNVCPCVTGVTSGTQQNPPPTEPPELLYLSQTSVSVGAPDFTLHVHGEHLDDDTDVVVNGVHYPTAFIDDHELEIVIHPSDNVPGTHTISLQNPNGTSATTLNFTFTP